MLKRISYWIGFIFLRHRGWQIEILRTAQQFFITKDLDILSFHLQSDSTRKNVYDQAIRIIDSWTKL